MPAAEIHKPPTGQIENGYRQNPHGINKRQTVTIAGRSLHKICDDCSAKDRLMKG